MKKYRKNLLLAVKIGIGSSIAIFIAQSLHLEYAASAGTVALLTLMTSKLETFRLSISRFATFGVTLALSLLVVSHVDNIWLAYGLILMLVVFIAESFGLRATISVNAVVAAHLVTSRDLSGPSVLNEFLLVLIGVTLAVILNLFHANWSHRRQIIADMRKVEGELQQILCEVAAYLRAGEAGGDVWREIGSMEGELQEFVNSAYEYQDNTFHSHPEYYIAYFEMRLEQFRILDRLRGEMSRIRSIPQQAAVVADYLEYLSKYVVEVNTPDRQIEYLDQIFDDMRRQELPKSREEFESRAILYHVLMDIQDFLACKAEFVAGLDETQRKRYWNRAGT